MNVRTYNVQLNCSEDIYNHFLGLLTQARDAYNLCTALIAEAKCQLTLPSVHAVCYDKVRSMFPMLPSQGAIRVEREALAAFRSIRSNKHKNASVPQRKYLSMTLDKRLYSRLTCESIALTCGKKAHREDIPFVKYDKLEEMFSKYIPHDPTLFIREGRLFLSIPFEVPSLPCKDDTSIGVDLGIKRLFVTSEGKYYKDKQYLKERRKLRYLKRCLQSNGTKSAKRHLRKLSKKERNVSKDMLHKATNALIASTEASILVLEDLTKIKVKTSKTSDGFKRKRHNNMMSQVPFAEFREMLSHKAQLARKQVATVSPMNTSKKDSRSGKMDGSRVGCRYYCQDGIVLDADWNAAINIALRGKHPTSTCLPIDGGLIALVGKAQSTASTSLT